MLYYIMAHHEDGQPAEGPRARRPVAPVGVANPEDAHGVDGAEGRHLR